MSDAIRAPWSYRDRIVRDADDYYVCEVAGAVSNQFHQTNARLIAAAPELLAALDEAVRLYTTYALVATPHEGAEDPMECGRWVNAARAAIAKAEGRE